MPVARPARLAGLGASTVCTSACIAACIPTFIAISIVTLLGACSSRGADCGPSEAIVERVIDGDTIALAGDVNIRYLLVAPPETTNGHADCYGANAAQFNADLVLGKTVQLTYDEACQDRFGSPHAGLRHRRRPGRQPAARRARLRLRAARPARRRRPRRGIHGARGGRPDARRGLWAACDPIPCQ